MKVFEVIFEVEDSEKKITNEINYWSGKEIRSVCLAAAAHAFEYEKEVTSVRYILTVVQHIEEEGEA